jgi:hypothetical protein
MTELEFDYSIRSDLPPHRESPAAVGAKFLWTLDALTRIDPTIFSNWEIMDYPAGDTIPLTTARSRIASIIEKNARRDDLQARPEWGYTAGALILRDARTLRMGFRVSTGGTETGDTWLRAGDHKVPADPATVTYPLFKAALLAIIAIWPPPWAWASAFQLGYQAIPLHPGEPLFPYSVFHVPWIAFLSAPHAAGLDLPPEILTERTPDGGLLMTATEERLDPHNRKHLRRARVIADVMIARTKHSVLYGPRSS